MDVQKIVLPDGAKELTILTGTAPSPLPPFNYQGFQYEAKSEKSFAALVLTKGEKEHAVVFMNDDGYYAILDDRVKDRKHDSVHMEYEGSLTVKEYGNILTSEGMCFKIKEFINFLKRRETGEIENIDELIYNVKNFKYVTNVNGDFTFDTRNNYTFSMTVSEAEGTVRIPTSITASIPVFEDSDWVQAMELELEIFKPKDASDGGPIFKLSCPKFSRYFDKAREYEEEALKKDLPGWMVVHGFSHK